MRLVMEGVVTWIPMKTMDGVNQGDYICLNVDGSHMEMVRVLEICVFETLYDGIRHRKGPRLKNMLVNYTKCVDATRYLIQKLGVGPYMFVNIVRKCWLDEINQ